MPPMAKLERLLNLMAALLETERPLRAEEIKHRIEGYPDGSASFHRAFERDKDDLREMGVPISLEPIPGTDPPVDGYRIRKNDYYLEDPGLEPDELAALHLAANAVRMEDLAGAEAVRKLGGAATDAVGDALASLPSDERLAQLFAAVTDRSLVSFDYRGETRTIEPLRLDFVRGRWYLSGYDRTRDDERHFRLDRMSPALEVGPPGGFDRRGPGSGVRMQPWELGDDPPRIATLLIDPDQAIWATHHVGPPTETRADGSIVIEVAVTNEAAFRSFVLTFLDHAEILEPPDLRQSMIGWLEDLAAEDAQ